MGNGGKIQWEEVHKGDWRIRRAERAGHREAAVGKGKGGVPGDIS